MAAGAEIAQADVRVVGSGEIGRNNNRGIQAEGSKWTIQRQNAQRNSSSCP